MNIQAQHLSTISKGTKVIRNNQGMAMVSSRYLLRMLATLMDNLNNNSKVLPQCETRQVRKPAVMEYIQGLPGENFQQFLVILDIEHSDRCTWYSQQSVPLGEPSRCTSKSDPLPCLETFYW